MINKLIDEPYWNELPEIIDKICKSKDFFFIPPYINNYMSGKVDTPTFYFLIMLLTTNNAKAFWQKNEKRKGHKTSLIGIKEKIIELDMEVIKYMMINCVMGLDINPIDETRAQNLLNKIKKQNDLNESFRQLIGFRINRRWK